MIGSRSTSFRKNPKFRKNRGFFHEKVIIIQSQTGSETGSNSKSSHKVPRDFCKVIDDDLGHFPMQFRGFFSNFFAISTWDEEGIPECFRKLRNAAECCGMLQNASLEISKVAKHVVTCAPLDPY